MGDSGGQGFPPLRQGADASEPLGTTDGAAQPHPLRAPEQSAARLPADTHIILIGSAPTPQAAGPPPGRRWLRWRTFVNAACPESFPETRAEGRAIIAARAASAARHPRFAPVDAAAPLCPGAAGCCGTGGSVTGTRATSVASPPHGESPISIPR